MADSNDFPISFFKTPEPDQLSLADIVGAVGEAAGPVLTRRRGLVGMPLGLGLSALGHLGKLLSDEEQQTGRRERTAAALRGIPGAEAVANLGPEGVHTLLRAGAFKQPAASNATPSTGSARGPNLFSPDIPPPPVPASAMPFHVYTEDGVQYAMDSRGRRYRYDDANRRWLSL
jgi:hypothetical protein